MKKYGDIFLTEDGLARNPDGVVFDGRFSPERRAKIHGYGMNDFYGAITKRVDEEKVFWTPYKMWQNMIQRAYSDSFSNDKTRIVLYPFWHRFSEFLIWLMEQPYREEYVMDFVTKGTVEEGLVYVTPISVTFKRREK